MIDLETLLVQKECAWLDFKREYHTNNAKLLHDILCLANAKHEGDRYLIFGVSDDATVFGVESDPKRKTGADLNDFLRKLALNRIPEIEIDTQINAGHRVDLLRIKNAAAKPYFVAKDYTDAGVTVRNGVVYTRLGDTNIPAGETAPEDHIELMWRERLGLLGNKPLSLEESFPVKLDDTHEHVRAVLGEPDDEAFKVEHFYTEGVEVSYDPHTDKVDGLIVCHLPSGTAFDGTVFGLRLGDDFSKVRSGLGKPDYWSLSRSNGSLAIWERDDRLVCCEIWRNTGDGKMVPVGTIKSIYYCNRKSYIGYIALVAIALEQMRKGIEPPIFEKGGPTLLDIDLDDPVFKEPYEILGAVAALLGGSEVLVAFTDSKVGIAFWVYPLMWSTPVIRSIGRRPRIDETASIKDDVVV
jgi:hypothetical protein